MVIYKKNITLGKQYPSVFFYIEHNIIMRKRRNRRTKSEIFYKIIKYFAVLTFLIIVIYFWIYFCLRNDFKIKIPQIIERKLEVEKIIVTSDADNDWINDVDDIIEWARKEVKNKTNYRSNYYSWGYPPNNEWVCTDVLWRALRNAWIDLKKLVDEDIKNNISEYSRVNWSPDPNIDFRRVPNLEAFLKRNAITLTTKFIPRDAENLKQWQPWDIVIFSKPDHVAIVSDKRNNNGVPYIIHNPAPYPKENERLLDWEGLWWGLEGHYRWKY